MVVNLILVTIQGIVVTPEFVAIETNHTVTDHRSMVDGRWSMVDGRWLQASNWSRKAYEDVNHSTAEKLPLFLRVSPHYSAL